MDPASLTRAQTDRVRGLEQSSLCKRCSGGAVAVVFLKILELTEQHAHPPTDTPPFPTPPSPALVGAVRTQGRVSGLLLVAAWRPSKQEVSRNQPLPWEP